MNTLNNVMKDASFFSIPRSWAQYILHTNFRMDGKPDWNQILVLSDIVYNMRYNKSRVQPAEVCRPEYTPDIVLSVEDISNNVNLTKNQVTAALSKLIFMGIVSRRYRSLKTSSGTVPKASLISLNLVKLAMITEQDISAKNADEKHAKNNVSYEDKKGRTKEVLNKFKEVSNSRTGGKASDYYDSEESFPKVDEITLEPEKFPHESSLGKDIGKPEEITHHGKNENENQPQFDSGWIYDICRRTGIIAQKQAMSKIKEMIAARHTRKEIEECLLWYADNYHLLRNHTSLPNLYGFVQWFGDISKELWKDTLRGNVKYCTSTNVW